MKRRMNWHEANQYVADLNTGGYTDWRLPTVYELLTVYNYSAGKPIMDCTTGSYWSSSTCACYSDDAWVVNMCGGIAGAGDKDGYYYVWPVRAGQYDYAGNLVIKGLKEGQERITNNGDGTVTDKPTGLMWMEDV